MSDSAQSNSPLQVPLPLPSSQDSHATVDSNVIESSKSEAAMSGYCSEQWPLTTP